MVSKADEMLVILLAFCLVLLAGCMTGTPSEATVLLKQDYLKMTDAQLVDYEQRLIDELVKSSRNSSGDLGIGFSFGSWGRSSGYAVQADQRIGSTENSIGRELRVRRNDVRIEMRRRGLLPK